MVQWIIAEVMADQEVDPDKIIPRYRRHSVYGWGTFKCTQCHVSWTSQITWVTLDIKEQRIRRRFKQKCKQCGQPQRPWWHVEEFAYMMEFVLDRYRKLADGSWKPAIRPNPQSEKAPHKSELCERCGFGSRKCWAVQDDGTIKEDDGTKENDGVKVEDNVVKEVKVKGNKKKAVVEDGDKYAKGDMKTKGVKSVGENAKENVKTTTKNTKKARRGVKRNAKTSVSEVNKNEAVNGENDVLVNDDQSTTKKDFVGPVNITSNVSSAQNGTDAKLADKKEFDGKKSEE